MDKGAFYNDLDQFLDRFLMSLQQQGPSIRTGYENRFPPQMQQPRQHQHQHHHQLRSSYDRMTETLYQILDCFDYFTRLIGSPMRGISEHDRHNLQHLMAGPSAQFEALVSQITPLPPRPQPQSVCSSHNYTNCALCGYQQPNCSCTSCSHLG